MESIISKPTRRHVEAAVNNFTTKSEALQSFFEQTLGRIMDQNPESRSLAIRTLSWIACCRDCLSLSELQHALMVENPRQGFEKRGIPELDSIISVCCGLAFADESRNIVSVGIKQYAHGYSRIRRFGFLTLKRTLQAHVSHTYPIRYLRMDHAQLLMITSCVYNRTHCLNTQPTTGVTMLFLACLKIRI
jgi:hypothetical protein